MTKTILTPLRLSENELALRNDQLVKILFKSAIIDVPAGHTIYLRDKASYSIHLIEDETYRGELWRVAVAETNPPETTEGRIVLDWQAEIEKEREAHLSRIDVEAEAVRGRYITLGSGQSMAYQQKLAEARLALEQPETDLAEIPHVAMEATDEGVTVAVKAAEIVAVANSWTFLSAEIERRRLAAKRAIRAAQDLADIDAAATVDWTISEATP